MIPTWTITPAVAGTATRTGPAPAAVSADTATVTACTKGALLLRRPVLKEYCYRASCTKGVLTQNNLY